MRPRRLYSKIFLSFLAILFVTELLIFILFLAIPAKRFGARLEQYTQQKVLILKNLIEEKIHSSPTTVLDDNQWLKEFIASFGQILGAKVWVVRPDGTILVQSFTGPIPPIVAGIKQRLVQHHTGSYQFYHRRHMDFYAVIPLDFSKDQAGTLHFLFEGMGEPKHEWYFALGLVVIGFIIALLVIPVSKPITRRIRQLRVSALRIAEGDIGHKVVVDGADEISQLAGAFNQMSGKLESIITSTKELTANISHELRTPLARIRIAEDLLREKLEKAQLVDWIRYLEDIRTDVDELDALVGRILALSKMDLSESPFTLESLNLFAMIRELLQRYQPIFAQKQLRIATDVDVNIHVTADADAFQTALSNLLDNAAKFTPEKGNVRIGATTGLAGVVLILENTFESLPEADLSKIFDPFHRAGRTPASGTGLGLAITRKIIEKHGGTIQARNTESGLAFEIWLPLKGVLVDRWASSPG